MPVTEPSHGAIARSLERGNDKMFSIFRSGKPKKPVYPLSAHPLIHAVFLPFVFLWLCVLLAYLSSTRLVVHTPLPPEIARAFGQPGKAILVGFLMGALMVLAFNRYEWGHAEEIARCRAERRNIYTMRNYLLVCLLVTVICIGATCALCRAACMSFPIAAYALLVPFFLSYRVKNHIYRLVTQYYRTAREAEAEPTGPIGPSRRQKLRCAALTAVLCAVLLTCTILALGWTPSVVFFNVPEARIAGMNISSDCAQYYEDCLIKEADVSERRAKLIGYYESLYARTPTPETASRLHTHLFWFIEHNPASFVGSPTEFLIERNEGDDAALQEAERLWQKAIDLHPKSAATLSNAANFYWYAEHDVDKAIELIARCVALKPADPEWTAKLRCFKALKQRQNADATANQQASH